MTSLLTVLPALLALALGGCSSSHARSGRPTMSEVKALLARHGKAVLDHSSKAFLADVDTAEAAKGFRARQAEEIDNISDVPLASWKYAVSAPVTDTSAQRAATKRYAEPALVVRLTLSYELSGIDRVPDPHDLWWTFVRRGGRVYIAGDDDLARAGGVSWRGPWDYGPVVVARGSSSLVLGHIGNALQLTALADTVDAAVPAVSKIWGTRWAQRVAVLVPGSEKEFAVLAGAARTSADISAVAVTAGLEPPAQAGGPSGDQPYGQRLVMAPDALGRLSTVGLRIVVRHEVTHLATAADTSDTTPRWLVEGFADYVAETGDGQSVRTTAAELRKQVLAGRVPKQLPADESFTSGAARLPQIYEQSWLACR
ncbi:MAG: hypothetical protein ACRDNS_27430, partial [Trebonia sp.]